MKGHKGSKFKAQRSRLIFEFCALSFPLLLIFGLLGCGSPPPAEFFTGTKDDSTQILSLIAETSPIYDAVFRVGLMEDSILPLDSVSRVFVRRYVSLAFAGFDDRTQARYIPLGFGRRVNTVVKGETLLFIKDTTADVLLRKELVGACSIRICSITSRPHPESLYDTTFVAKDTVIVKPFTATVWQWAHFEPIKKDTSPRRWRLLKVSGCQVVSMPNPENSPILPYRNSLVIATPQRTDTVFPLAYYRDSLLFGDRRLYYYIDTVCLKKDSLPVLPAGERLTAISFIPWLNPQDTCIKFIAYGGERRAAATGITLPSSPQFARIYFEAIPLEGLIFEKKSIRGIAWGVSTKIK